MTPRGFEQEGLNGMRVSKVAAAFGMIVLAGLAGPSRAQGSSAQGGSTQEAIPNAPRPQTLPDLNTLTPVGPAVPSAPPPANVGAPAKDDQLAPTSSLPNTSVPPTPSAEDADQGPPPDLNASVFRLPTVRVNFVQIPFTVKDSKGALVPAITWRDVRVYENGIRQRLAVFTSDPFPMSVALVIDQSVTFDTMQKINNSLQALQGAFAPYDELAIFTYNNGVKEQTVPTDVSKYGFLGAQTPRLGAVLEISKAKGREPDLAMGGPLDQTQIKNNEIVDPNTTAQRNQQGIYQTPEKEYHTLNDAILAAAIAVSHAQPGRRRVVYVISDGKEYGSKATEKEVIRYCQTNGIEVYATLVGDSSVPGVGFLDRIHLPLTMRDNVLPRYTAATGTGLPDYEFRQGGIEKSFQKIALQARYQYTLGYYSHESALDEKYRRTEVQVMRPNLSVIAKPGYYPTPSAGAGAPRVATANPAQVATP
jgi:VWFA-related protein